MWIIRKKTFHSVSCGLTIVSYFMLNPLYTYISNIQDLVWLGFMAYQPGYFILNPFNTYILNIQDLVWWVLWNINQSRLFIAESYLYIYNKYIIFGWVGFYDISIIVG